MILYIQTAFLGDLLLSIPTLKRLREIYPKQEIHLLCRKGLGSILKENQLVDVVHDQFSKTKPNYFEIRKTFSHLNYDLIVCPHESFRSTGITSYIRAQRKIGFKNWLNSWVFTDYVERPMHLPEALRQLSLLQFVDPQTTSHLKVLAEFKAPFKVIPPWSSMKLPQYQETSKKSHWKKKHGLSLDRKIICLAPGSVWPTKQWGVEKYSQLAQQIIKTGSEVVLVGSASEQALCQKIKTENPEVLNLAGQTKLPELAEVIAVCDVLVSNDSGSMHIAAMTNTPSVSLFGPTVLEFGYQPWNEKAVVIENKTLRCRPCSSHGGKVCPIGTHECMTSIASQDVLKEVISYCNP
jgi:heptosyltransferase II